MGDGEASAQGGSPARDVAGTAERNGKYGERESRGALWQQLLRGPTRGTSSAPTRDRADYFGVHGLPSSPWRLWSEHGVVAQVHTDAAAGAFARSLNAHAVTVGSHTYFAPGAFRPGTPEGDRLIRHELTHVAQAQLAQARPEPRSHPARPEPFDRVAGPDSPAEHEADQRAAGSMAPVRARAAHHTAYRHPIIRTTAEHHAEADVVGAGPGTGMTLAAFDDWSGAQRDWFAGITEASRTGLWRLRALLDEGEQIRAGLGLMHVPDLLALPAVDLDALRWYAAGSVEAADTVRITTPTAVVADARDRGAKMRLLEALVGGPPLRIAMPQTDFEAIAASPVMWPRLFNYVTMFRPHFEVAREMPGLITFLSGADPTTFVPLRGHIRDLHRFPIRLLNDELRLWGTRGTRVPPVTLALQSGHDWTMSFEHADQVLLPPLALDPRFRLLIVEGPDSLVDAQNQVQDIGTNFGPIQDVFLIGHGESRQIGLAAAPGVATRGGRDYARYPQEKLDLTNSAVAGGTPTTRFFDALLRNMDPVRARVVFLGCLVGTTEVPQQITDPVTNVVRAPTEAEIRAFYADPQRMAMRAWLEQRPAAIGLGGFSPGFVTGARADTGIGGMTGLTNWLTGRADITYGMDAPVFGSAEEYVRSGLEPTGLMRSLRELMATAPLATAIGAINYRILNPVVSATAPWWAAVSNAMASLAFPAVMAGNLDRVHALDAVAQHAFLSYFAPDQHKEQLASFAAGDAAALFPPLLAALNPARPDAPSCRLVLRQAWAAIDATQVATFRAELDATPLVDRTAAPLLLPRARLAPMLPVLLPLPLPGLPTRGQLLLAFALANGSPARATAPGPGDPQELQFLYAVAVATRSFPAPASATLLAGFASPSSLLEAIGLGAATALPPAAPPPVGATDRANARLGGEAAVENDVFIHGAAYTATVVPTAVRVRAAPNLAAPQIHLLFSGDTVHVVGMVHGWAAIEFSERTGPGHRGRLGFVWGALLTPHPTP
jgi:hypothetical protein